MCWRGEWAGSQGGHWRVLNIQEPHSAVLNGKCNVTYTWPVLPFFFSPWSLLLATIWKIMLGLNGPLLWSPVAAFMWASYSREWQLIWTFFCMGFFHPFSNRTEYHLPNLFKEMWLLLFIVWAAAFMLSIEAFSHKLLAFTKLFEGGSFPCTSDVFCF